MSEIERMIVDYFDTNGADVESRDGEWVVYINDGEGTVSLTGLALALSQADGGTAT